MHALKELHQPKYQFWFLGTHNCLLLDYLQLPVVLALAGVIFFTIAGTGLCIGFVLETQSTIQGCFFYCSAVFATSSKPFLFLPTSKWAGGAQKLGMGHSWNT